MMHNTTILQLGSVYNVNSGRSRKFASFFSPRVGSFRARPLGKGVEVTDELLARRGAVGGIHTTVECKGER